MGDSMRLLPRDRLGTGTGDLRGSSFAAHRVMGKKWGVEVITIAMRPCVARLMLLMDPAFRIAKLLAADCQSRCALQR